jgi:hypothetical protein
MLNSVSLHNLSTQLDVAEEAQAQLSQVGVHLAHDISMSIYHLSN